MKSDFRYFMGCFWGYFRSVIQARYWPLSVWAAIPVGFVGSFKLSGEFPDWLNRFSNIGGSALAGRIVVAGAMEGLICLLVTILTCLLCAYGAVSARREMRKAGRARRSEPKN